MWPVTGLEVSASAFHAYHFRLAQDLLVCYVPSNVLTKIIDIYEAVIGDLSTVVALIDDFLVSVIDRDQICQRVLIHKQRLVHRVHFSGSFALLDLLEVLRNFCV